MLFRSSLDSSEGLYWAYERSAFVERVVSEEEIEHFTKAAPEDTRAWTRAMLLRSVSSDVVDDVNWDSISFKFRTGRGRTLRRRLEMANPLHFTKAATEQIFNEATSLDQMLDALGAPRKDESGGRTQKGSRSEQTPGLMRVADLISSA